MGHGGFMLDLEDVVGMDDMACRIIFHLSHRDTDGDSRIIIKYLSDDQFDQAEAGDVQFKPNKRYNIRFDRDELVVLKKQIDKVLQIWPLVMGEVEDAHIQRSVRPDSEDHAEKGDEQ